MLRNVKWIIGVLLIFTMMGTVQAVISPGNAVIKLNGVDHIEVADNNALSIQKQMTISFWMRPSDFVKQEGDSYVVPIIKGRSGEHEWNFKVYQKDAAGDNKVSFGIYNSDGKGVSSYFKVNLNSEWIYITAKVDGKKIYLYKNGIVQDQDIYYGIVAPVNGKAPLLMATSNKRQYFEGNIADEEIREIYAGGLRFQLTSNKGNYISSDALGAWYKLNDDDSVITDYSVNGRSGKFYSNGVLAEPLLVSITESLVEKDPLLESDLWFDGQNDLVEIDDHNDFSVSTTEEMTISAWIKPNALTFDNTAGTGFVHWLSKGDNGEYEWAFRMYSADNSEGRHNRISFYLFNREGGLGAGSYVEEDVRVGEWIHLVAKVDGERIYLYKNGILKDSDLYKGEPYFINPSNQDAPVRIGGGPRGFFEGAVGDVAVFNRALSNEEIAIIYQGGQRFGFSDNSGNYNGAENLVLWYQLRAGELPVDLSGNHHEGVFRG